MLELRKDKGTDYVLSWKSKGVLILNLRALHTAFLHNINLSGHKMGIRPFSCKTKQLCNQNCKC